MLKTRIIPVILYRGHQAVKGKQFQAWRSVGSVVNAVRVHARRAVDELILLDIGATPEGRDPDFALIRELSAVVMSPLTVGGGITSVEHFREALRCGADKVAVRTAALRDPDLISRAAERFGRQAVTVAIDFVDDREAVMHDAPVRQLQVEKDGFVIGFGVEDLPLREADHFESAIGRAAAIDGRWRGAPRGCFLRRSRVVEFAKRCEHLGAGELLVTSVSRDGLLCGYDIDLLRDVSRAVGIPVVANGGAGGAGDFAAALRAGAHAVAAGALWLWRDITPAECIEDLWHQGFLVRREGAVENQIVAAE